MENYSQYLIFLDCQSCQLVKNDQRFRHHLRPHYQDLVIFNQLTWLMTQEDLSHVAHWKSTVVSKEHVIFIFKVE
jgi:hypothetical protein